jgi:hypothetical protein
MTIQNVSEFPANAPEKIEHFAKLLRSSEQKRAVFSEIYRGQSKDAKTAEAIARETGLKAKRVLEIATPLAAHQLFEKTKHDGQTAYKKYADLNTVKRKILTLATNKGALARHVTKRNPRTSTSTLRIEMAKGSAFVDVRAITIEDVDCFSKVRSLKHRMVPKRLSPERLPEKVFKYAIASILGNQGTFVDWGGEKNDLYSSHLRIKGQRYATAVGLKGPATKPPLTPGKMGKNGDQIQRLFDSDAQVFLVQFEGEISELVVQQLRKLAVAKSVEDRRTVFYGVIALEDSYRLRMKYKSAFVKASTRALRNGKR